ncbi:MAG: hypothetical protein QOC64_2 [Solirubrobacteraceae bacterium]|nr:hypothetical protein [Solirubrobacteraceae bacterium]
MAWPASPVATFASSTERTWRSAPSATPPTPSAISPTARPVSSEIVAICCEAEPSVAAVSETWPIIAPSAPRVSL